MEDGENQKNLEITFFDPDEYELPEEGPDLARVLLADLPFGLKVDVTVLSATDKRDDPLRFDLSDEGITADFKTSNYGKFAVRTVATSGGRVLFFKAQPNGFIYQVEGINASASVSFAPSLRGDGFVAPAVLPYSVVGVVFVNGPRATAFEVGLDAQRNRLFPTVRKITDVHYYGTVGQSLQISPGSCAKSSVFALKYVLGFLKRILSM
ncbi:MAG: hypothetical protein WC797_00890 [Candidatus Paceibacterota bacterium]